MRKGKVIAGFRSNKLSRYKNGRQSHKRNKHRVHILKLAWYAWCNKLTRFTNGKDVYEIYATYLRDAGNDCGPLYRKTQEIRRYNLIHALGG